MDLASLVISILGLVASIAGVIFACLALRAAKSAETAAREAQNSVSQTFCLVSAQRALSVIARLNALHRDQNWTAAMELYRELRTLLNDIGGMIPQGLEHSRADIHRGIGQLSLVESLVEQVITKSAESSGHQLLNTFLNSIQTTLEALVSRMMPPGETGSETDG